MNVVKKLLNPRFRLALFALLAVCLQACLWLISPEQAPVILYKLGLPLLAAILGLFFDAAVFPYARPSSYLTGYWEEDPEQRNRNFADYPVVHQYLTAFNAACLRRAIIIAAFVLAVALGL